MNGKVISFHPKSHASRVKKDRHDDQGYCLNQLREMRAQLRETLIGIEKTENAIRSGDVEQMIEVRNMMREKLQQTKEKD